jgi:hypothetical protein
MRGSIASFFVLGAPLVCACVGPPPKVPAQLDTARYESSHAWLCLPGRSDECAGDLSATELHADGTRTIEASPPPAASPKADCFYVYPTVDMSLIPGNHDDFLDRAPMAMATVAQAARFRETCALYVPFYRQVTIGSYLQPRRDLDGRLAFAFSDVDAAFEVYLQKYNHGRPIVLLGHSQGADMIARLVTKYFDGDPAMRARLVVATPIGAEVAVAKGSASRGTFVNVPACTRASETGCVIAYRSHAAGDAVDPGRAKPPAGYETLCVNPGDVEHNTMHAMSRAYLPITDRTRRRMRGADGVTTPFMMLRDFYAARCADGPDGYRYLEVAIAKAAGDVRENPVDFARMPFKKQLGLHLVDYQLPQGDLLDDVARRVAAWK